MQSGSKENLGMCCRAPGAGGNAVAQQAGCDGGRKDVHALSPPRAQCHQQGLAGAGKPGWESGMCLLSLAEGK